MTNFFKKYWIVLVLFIALDFFTVKYGILKSDKEITAPGGLNSVNSLITVENDFDLTGSFNTVYVNSYDYVTELQAFLVNGIDKTSSVTVANSTFDLSYQENIKSGEIQKDQSIETSLIVAYNAAIANGYSFNLDYSFLGFIVYTRQKNQHNLEIGDIIYKIESDVTTDNSDMYALADALNGLKVGDKVYYKRGDSDGSFVYNKEVNYDDADRFYCYTKFKIDSETSLPKYELHEASTLGPSGGFMQTLATYCYITGKDLTNGLKIAGTGTISLNGSVGAIGGISQKITTAIRNKVDIFLCPEMHYEEALETYNKTLGHERMILIKIDNFTDGSSNALKDAIAKLEAIQ